MTLLLNPELCPSLQHLKQDLKPSVTSKCMCSCVLFICVRYDSFSMFTYSEDLAIVKWLGATFSSKKMNALNCRMISGLDESLIGLHFLWEQLLQSLLCSQPGLLNHTVYPCSPTDRAKARQAEQQGAWEKDERKKAKQRDRWGEKRKKPDSRNKKFLSMKFLTENTVAIYSPSCWSKNICFSNCVSTTL